MNDCKYFFHNRGKEFRKDFKELSCLKAFFPRVPMLALTATAPPSLIQRIAESLSMNSDVKIINKNPNRENVFLDKKTRLPNQYGSASYEEILKPIAEELLQRREKYPMTIIYMKLKYCGFAYQLFNKILEDCQFVGDDNEPCSRLFAQFHAPQTSRMKVEILNEIKKESSRIRVLFATVALGMGVNVPYVSRIVHIGPPSSLEAYMQEIGRAGRSGSKSIATMHYNNSDIAQNNDTIDDSIRQYCRSDSVCLRKILLNYFGFQAVKQEECCVICKQSLDDSTITCNATPRKVRDIPVECVEQFCKEAKRIIDMHIYNAEQSGFILNYGSDDSSNQVKRIKEGICFIESESDLLHNYDIWDENCSKALFELITKFAPNI